MRKFFTGLASAALLASAATPAVAGGRDNDVDALEVAAAAVAAVGIAALATAVGDAKRARQDAAVDACSGEAESRTGDRVFAILHVGKLGKGYYSVEGAFEGDDDGPRNTFTCTIRRGAIYSFETSGRET